MLVSAIFLVDQSILFFLVMPDNAHIKLLLTQKTFVIISSIVGNEFPIPCSTEEYPKK